jgi:hypothetical protein
MDFFSNLFNYFTDSDSAVIKKLTNAVILVLVLLAINYAFSFSYYRNVSQKLSAVQKINKMLESEHLPVFEIKELNRVRKEILLRNPSTSFSSVLKKFIISFNDQRSFGWHFISSSWFIWALMIYLPFIPLLQRRNIEMKTMLAIAIIVEPLLFSISWVFAWCLSYVPLINSKPMLNYLANVIISFIFFMLLIAVFKKTKDSGEEYE